MRLEETDGGHRGAGTAAVRHSATSETYVARSRTPKAPDGRLRKPAILANFRYFSTPRMRTRSVRSRFPPRGSKPSGSSAPSAISTMGSSNSLRSFAPRASHRSFSALSALVKACAPWTPSMRWRYRVGQRRSAPRGNGGTRVSAGPTLSRAGGAVIRRPIGPAPRGHRVGRRRRQDPAALCRPVRGHRDELHKSVEVGECWVVTADDIGVALALLADIESSEAVEHTRLEKVVRLEGLPDLGPQTSGRESPNFLIHGAAQLSPHGAESDAA